MEKIIKIEELPYSVNKYVTIEIDNQLYQGIIIKRINNEEVNLCQ